MGDESPKLASTPTGAVFLSYASQDAAAAQRMCEALRATGVEVWFDQSELRGGDAWDQKIRRQIHECRLFIAVISAHTEARDEGYFRREWKLAVDRTHDMAEDKAFVVPVVIDGTSERSARVPDSFKHVQWTRLPGGETPPAFVQRVQRLLSPEPPTTSRPATGGVATAPTIGESSRASWWSKPAALAIVAVLSVALAYFVVYKLWSPKHVTEAPPAMSAAPAAAAATTAAAFNPPPHSIAVLPFVNISGDREQEYFSDGLTEELLNSLARIDELQVAARTSSFSFQGEHPDIATVARKLNVASVLEGSVRRSGHTIRITVQLNNAVTGFHIWSQTFDRDLGDVLQLQTEIATEVAGALKVTLLGDASARIELGGTRNPAAFDAFLRGRKASHTAHSDKDMQTAIAALTEAIHLDQNYALAFANRSLAFNSHAMRSLASGVSADVRESFDKAQADALRAIALAPDLAEGHLALAAYFETGLLSFTQANEEYERALALAPGNARVSGVYGRFAARMDRAEAGITALRRSVALDPLTFLSHASLGWALYNGRRYDEALAEFQEALDLDPNHPESYTRLGFAYYALGEFERARVSCERRPDSRSSQQCLAITYDKLGRHADAEAMLTDMKASQGDNGAYNYATIYTQWGNRTKALEWLDTAMRLRDPSLSDLKVDPLLDPLRNEPRFQAIERELKFPQ